MNDGTSQAPGGTPLYARIAGDLRARIADGTYPPGALLPSRNELSAMYSVSAITSRDALAVLSQEGLAQAIRGRGHIVRRLRPRLDAPGRMYAAGAAAGTIFDPAVLITRQVDVYQEIAPDNIALPLECGTDPVWVRRAVFAASADRRPAQIHVSWLPGLSPHAAARLRAADPAAFWPQTVQHVTGRAIASVRQNTRARGANPFEATAFGIPGAAKILVTHLTTYDSGRRPVEHSRYAWPTDTIRLTEEYSYPAQSEPPR